MESVLFKIFSEYTMQSGTFQTNLLRSSRFSDLCKDSGLLPSEGNRRRVESFGRSLGFEEFCVAMRTLARARFPASGESEAYRSLIEEFMGPLAREISHKWSTVETKDLNLPNAVIKISQCLFQSFKKIYLKEFPWEMATDKPLSKLFALSLRKMQKLLVLFEVFPDDISKITVHGLWRDVVIMPEHKVQELLTSALVPQQHCDIGRALSLSKFILFCYFCSLYGHFDKHLSPTFKFLEFIDKIKFAISKKIEFRDVKMAIPENTLRMVKSNDQQKNTVFFVAPSEKLTLTLHTVYDSGNKKENCQLGNLSLKEAVEGVFRRLNSKSARKTLSLLSKVILPVFKHYCDNEKCISYPSFLKFSREFEIVNEKVSFKYLKELFDIVLLLNEEETTLDVTYEKSITKVDFPKFMNIFAILACNDETEKRIEEKLCYFVSKLGMSKGLSIVHKTQGHLRKFQIEIYKIQRLLKI